MAGKRKGSASVPEQLPLRVKTPAGKFNVWLPLDVRDRIDGVQDLIARRVHVKLSYTDLVQFLVVEAVEKLEGERKAGGAYREGRQPTTLAGGGSKMFGDQPGP